MFGTYCRLGVNVSASDFDVMRAARRKIAVQHRRGRARRADRHRFYRQMLAYHRDARGLYRDVMFGDTGAD
jgi:hypothetical protein